MTADATRFRWASLRIQNLCDPPRIKIVKNVEAALERLLTTLSELYALISDLISRTESEGRSIAEAVLRWLLYSQRPLSNCELIDFVSHRSDGIATINRAGYGRHTESLLQCCHPGL